MSWIVEMVLRLIGFLLDRRSAVAQARLQDREAADEAAEAAIAAARAADAAASAPGGLRAPADPDCRDCRA